MAQTGRVLSFLRARPSSGDWTQQELAEFYRVEGALLQGGLLVTTDRGFSDEGDPWFVFCRPDNEEVIAHFARIDGDYLVISSAFSGVARGRDFKLLIRELMQAHPLMLSRNHGDGQRVFLHPSALLAALLAASYLISSDKDATAQDLSPPGHEKESGFWLHFRHDFAILSAVAIAAAWIENSVESTFDFGQHVTLLQDTGQDSHLLVDHAIDAAFFDAAVQALHDDAISPHGVAGDPVHAFTIDATNVVNDVMLATSLNVPTNVPTHSTVASTPDATVTTAFKVEGISAAHTDDMTASHTMALNDAGPLSSSMQAVPNFAIAAVQPLASSAMAPANLGSSSIVPTGTVGEVTNDLAVFKQDIVLSTAQLAPSPTQNTPTAIPLPASATQTSASTTGSAQASTDAPAQVVASTDTQASALNSITQQSDAHHVRGSHFDQLETPHAIVGIMSHDFMGPHVGA
jgi:hypothetical protein